MNKKYIVRLMKKEREESVEVVKRLKGSSQKVRQAQILLKADIRGPNWTDTKIAEASGYGSPEYMATVLRQTVGPTPLKYRAQAGGRH